MRRSSFVCGLLTPCGIRGRWGKLQTRPSCSCVHTGGSDSIQSAVLGTQQVAWAAAISPATNTQQLPTSNQQSHLHSPADRFDGFAWRVLFQHHRARLQAARTPCAQDGDQATVHSRTWVLLRSPARGLAVSRAVGRTLVSMSNTALSVTSIETQRMPVMGSVHDESTLELPLRSQCSIVTITRDCQRRGVVRRELAIYWPSAVMLGMLRPRVALLLNPRITLPSSSAAEPTA